MKRRCISSILCNITKRSWNLLQYFVSQYFYIPEITPQSAFFGFFKICSQQNFLLINRLLLIFKDYLHNHYLYHFFHKQACSFVAAGLFWVCLTFWWIPDIKGLKPCYDVISFLEKIVIKWNKNLCKKIIKKKNEANLSDVINFYSPWKP